MRSPNQNHAGAMHAARRARSDRLAREYRDLREGGLSVAAAAAAMGVSRRMAERYQARLRQAGWVPPGSQAASRWNSTTDRTASARRPPIASI